MRSASERPPKDRLIKQPEVEKVTCLPRSTMYREMRHGRFPLPVKVGRLNYWRLVEVERWISSLKAVEIEIQTD